MTQSQVRIQIDPESVPTTPPWFAEAAAFAQVLNQRGLLKAIQEQVRFARARFGHYDLLDFVVVLSGYALSGEATLKAFYERLSPFAQAYMALFGRHRLPHRSTLSRFLATLDQASVEALRALFQEDLGARAPFDSAGGLWDRTAEQWLVIDVDGTRQAARQRALPSLSSLPAPHRRFTAVCAPGYLGRQRGEVVRTRTTVLQAHTHQWLGTCGGSGNGDYRGELKRAIQATTSYASRLGLSLSQVLLRLDGLYGNAAPLSDILAAGLGFIARSKDYSLLDLEVVRKRMTSPADQERTHPESGVTRALYDCKSVPLAPGGLCVRLIIASHPATSSPPAIGVERDGAVYELFVSTISSPAFLPSDVLDLYLHRGSFEPVLADEDQEQDPDRWCSHTGNGQEFWQILSQWIWNLRLELGQQLSPSALRTTEFASALEASPAPVAPSVPSAPSPAPVSYGPPKFARPSFTGGFPGSAFTLQPDDTLRCPADHPLYPQERRRERDGSIRLLYAARIGQCRACHLRPHCQESPLTTKPRRVSAVFWPVSSDQAMVSPPGQAALHPPPKMPEPVPRSPILWRDWPRSQLRRRWMKVTRTETVTLTMGAPPPEDHTDATGEHVLTRAQRAHWRLSWQERFARNARSSSAPLLEVTIHGLPATFANVFGFGLVKVA